MQQTKWYVKWSIDFVSPINSTHFLFHSFSQIAWKFKYDPKFKRFKRFFFFIDNFIVILYILGQKFENWTYRIYWKSYLIRTTKQNTWNVSEFSNLEYAYTKKFKFFSETKLTNINLERN